MLIFVRRKSANFRIFLLLLLTFFILFNENDEFFPLGRSQQIRNTFERRCAINEMSSDCEINIPAIPCDEANLRAKSTVVNALDWESKTYPLPIVRYTLTGHTSSIRDLAYSSDGQMLASVSEDKTIKLWNGSNGMELYTLTGHQTSIDCITFNPDNQLMASCSSDSVIKVWDVKTGNELRNMTGGKECVVFSPDGHKIATGGRSIKIWDVNTGTLLHTMIGHSNVVLSLSFSSDGQILASGGGFYIPGGQTSIKLWDVSSGNELQTLTGHESEVISVSFVPNSQKLVSAERWRIIKVWDITSGTEQASLEFSGPIVSTSLGFNGQIFTCAINFINDRSMISLWDLSTYAWLGNLKCPSHLSDIEFSPVGQAMASSSNVSITIWETSFGFKVQTLRGHSNYVNSVAFSPDSQLLASGSSDTTIKVWNVSSNSQLHALTGHFDVVNEVKFSPNGEILASSSSDMTIKMWELSTGSEIRTLNGHSDLVSSISFSPDGEKLASGSADNEIRIWDVATGNELDLLQGHSNPIVNVVFSPLGKFLASCDSDNNIKVWDVTTGTELYSLPGGGSDVAFDPEGEKLVSSYSSGLRLWNVSTGYSLINISEIGLNPVFNPVFSSDGEILAASTYVDAPAKTSYSGITMGPIFGGIALWHIKTGNQLIILHSHRYFINSLVFSPDGQFLASSGYYIKLWNLTSGIGLPEWWKELYQLNSTNSYGFFDADWDGLTNLQEYLFGTSPLTSDTDFDEIPDYYEYQNGLDGTSNDATQDKDGDGLSNLQEYNLGWLANSPDSDNDQMPDGFEFEFNLNGTWNDSFEDKDGDGMYNLYEFQHGLLANSNDAYEDKDNDGMPNVWECQNGLEASNPSDASHDNDKDGLLNLEEFNIGTDPNLLDSDGDGVPDGRDENPLEPRIMDIIAYSLDNIFFLVFLIMVIFGGVIVLVALKIKKRYLG